MQQSEKQHNSVVKVNKQGRADGGQKAVFVTRVKKMRVRIKKTQAKVSAGPLSPSVTVGTPFLQEFGDYLSPYFPAQTQPHSRPRSKVLHQVQLIIFLNRKVGFVFVVCFVLGRLKMFLALDRLLKISLKLMHVG